MCKTYKAEQDSNRSGVGIPIYRGVCILVLVPLPSFSHTQPPLTFLLFSTMVGTDASRKGVAANQPIHQRPGDFDDAALHEPPDL